MAKYTLIQIHGNQQTEMPLQQGQKVQAQAQTVYRLKDEQGAQPHKLAIWRRGQDMVLDVQGQDALTLQGFYASTPHNAADAPHFLLDTGVPGNPWIVQGRAPQQKISDKEDLVWRLDDDVVHTTLSPDQLQQVWAQSDVQHRALTDQHHEGDHGARQEIQDLLNRWKPRTTHAGAATATSVVDASSDTSAAGSTPTTPAGSTPTTPVVVTPPAVDDIGDLIITGHVAAGPVHSGVTLYAYDATGQQLGTSTINADGSYRISVAHQGNYRGTVLLKVVDSNATGTNYQDEVTGADKSLSADLRALGVAQSGQTLFTIVGLDSHLIINITPLTELAVRQAGVTGNAAVSAQAALQANANVAQAFGLANVDLTGEVTPTNSAAFDARNGLSDAEKYGLALAKLSGLDALNGGNMATSLDMLAANLVGNALNTTGAKLVDQGRAQALAALKANSTTFNAGTGDTDTNTLLNRQLLGDIIVTSQTLDSGNHLTVTGTALPSSTVIVTLPDGSTQTAAVDASGHFSLTSTQPQPVLNQPVHVQGSDALSAPVTNAAPNAPVIDMGNSHVITGTGDPGTTVTVFDGSTVLGTAVVDALGHWSLTPATPVVNGTALHATAQDTSGNASGPGAGAINANAVIIRIPEAADGYINATEKASGGGVPIVVSLPANAAVGDMVQSQITLPDGSQFTLSKVLTAQDLSNGQVTQLMAATQLPTDGLYQVATTLTHGTTTSAANVQSFLIDATAPAAPAIAPCNGQVINGTAEPGTVVSVYNGAGQLIGTVGPVGADGNWTLVPANPLPNNTPLHATAADMAGNTSGPGNGVVDTGALLITGAVDNVGPNLGLLLDGAITNDSSPQISGSLGTPLAAGQTLAIYRNGVFIGNATVNGTSWNLQDANLADGNYAYTANIVSGTTVIQSSGEFNLTVLTAPPAAPATTVPEATDQLINATEKASDGGVPVVTLVPAGARVGDVVTTVVELPNGTTLTLSTVLSPADIQAGRISQLIGVSNLSTDGVYPVSTTYTSALTGLTSAPTDNTFTLDTTAPSAPLVSLTEAPGGSDTFVNASEAQSLGGTPVLTTLPADARAGDTVTTLVTRPDGTTLTLTTVLSAADITLGHISQTIVTAQLTQDGSWTTSTTITDPAGNTSAATAKAFTLDTAAPATPGVSIPEAPGGVSATEKASGGGVPLQVTLPNDAQVGDTVTTVVTLPDHTTLTLSTVLSAADIAAGQIPQLIPTTALTQDGTWTTSTTLTDAAGNSSAPQTDSFRLAATAPTLSLNTVAGDGQINATEQTGALPVTGSTSAEPGQAVMVKLMNGSTVVGTYYTTVRPDGTFALNIPQADMAVLTDGSYTLTADVSNAAGTPAVQASTPAVLDTTAPTITITHIADSNGGGSDNFTFDLNERGFDPATYQSTTTVAVLPVIRGTTTAEVGQSVTIDFNGHSYSATVVAGANGQPNTWSVAISQTDAMALVHGSTYPVTASVSDLAGNLAAPATASLNVNIAPADVPTIVQNYGHSAQPVLTGSAQKLSNGNPIALANGDVLTFVIDGVTITATIDSTSANGTNNPGVTYDSTSNTWSLSVGTVTGTNSQSQPVTGLTLADGTYNVSLSVAVTGGGAARSDISTGELVINTAPPTITLNPISPDAQNQSVINAFEHSQSQTLTGTTNAEPGSTVTLSLNGQT